MTTELQRGAARVGSEGRGVSPGTPLFSVETTGRFRRLLAAALIVSVAACGGGGGASFAGIGGDPGSDADSTDRSGTDGAGSHGSGTDPGGDTPTDPTRPSYIVSGKTTGVPGLGMVLQLNDTQEATVEPGGVFRFGTPLPEGSAYSVTVKKQPVDIQQNCSVENGSGTIGGGDITVDIRCSVLPARFAHVEQIQYQFADAQPTVAARLNLHTYAINPTSGALSSSAVTALSSTTTSVALHPSGRFALLLDLVLGTGTGDPITYTVSSHRINATTGSPEPPALSSVQWQESLPAYWSMAPVGKKIVIDVAGRFAYLTAIPNPAGSTQTLRINADNGTLELVDTMPGEVAMLRFHPSGRFAYATIPGQSEQVTAIYAVDPQTGRLTATSRTAAIYNLVIDPTGRFAYGGVGNQLMTYRIDDRTGALNAIDARTIEPPEELGLPSVAPWLWTLSFHPSGQWANLNLIVSNPNSQIFRSHQILAMNAITGILNPAIPPTLTDDLSSVYFDPAGRFAYASTLTATREYGVRTYSVDPGTGVIAPTSFLLVSLSPEPVGSLNSAQLIGLSP